MDILTLFDSLVEASFRGLPFTIPDARHETGRRVERFLFPGQDAAAFQDLGALDGCITIRGLIVGDNYVRAMQRLEQAFRQPGPATLVHPWLGEMLVVARPAHFTFDQSRYRVVAFEVEVWRYQPNEPASPDTLTALLDTLDDLRTAARALLRLVLAPVALALAVVGYAERFVGNLFATYSRTAYAITHLQIPGVAAAMSELTMVGVSPAASSGTGYADTLAGKVAAPANAGGRGC